MKLIHISAFVAGMVVLVELMQSASGFSGSRALAIAFLTSCRPVFTPAGCLRALQRHVCTCACGRFVTRLEIRTVRVAPEEKF